MRHRHRSHGEVERRSLHRRERAGLRAFAEAVLTYTGAARVDIVGHSLGGIAAQRRRRHAGPDRVALYPEHREKLRLLRGAGRGVPARSPPKTATAAPTTSPPVPDSKVRVTPVSSARGHTIPLWAARTSASDLPRSPAVDPGLPLSRNRSHAATRPTGPPQSAVTGAPERDGQRTGRHADDRWRDDGTTDPAGPGFMLQLAGRKISRGHRGCRHAIDAHLR